jgi:Cellulase (glycosyl hydrolase family 5)
MTDSAATGSFYVADGKIIDPNGSTFVARGVDVLEGNQPSASTLQSDFPGVNFVRLAIYDYANPADLSSYVNSLTSNGIVVDLEDHTNSTGQNAGGNTGTIYTGQQLSNELNWYSSAASTFKDNANVWFGTDNEPSETDSSGNYDPSALSDWQKETYDAIRGAGNNNPVLMEAVTGSGGATNVGFNTDDYAGMTNVAWDAHYYGWMSNYSTDEGVVASTLSKVASSAQQITSADGTMPVIIGEYGNSTDGQNVDANGSQVMTAVQDSGFGSAAWAYMSGNADGLINDNGSLSSLGQEVASFIASAASNDTSSAIASTGSASAVASTGSTSATNNDDVALLGSGSSLTDSNGANWTITDGATVDVNGAAAGYSANVQEIALVNGTIWQENMSDLWWSWNGSGWTSSESSPLA